MKARQSYNEAFQKMKDEINNVTKLDKIKLEDEAQLLSRKKKLEKSLKEYNKYSAIFSYTQKCPSLPKIKERSIQKQVTFEENKSKSINKRPVKCHSLVALRHQKQSYLDRQSIKSKSIVGLKEESKEGEESLSNSMKSGPKNSSFQERMSVIMSKQLRRESLLLKSLDNNPSAEQLGSLLGQSLFLRKLSTRVIDSPKRSLKFLKGKNKARYEYSHDCGSITKNNLSIEKEKIEKVKSKLESYFLSDYEREEIDHFFENYEEKDKVGSVQKNKRILHKLYKGEENIKAKLIALRAKKNELDLNQYQKENIYLIKDRISKENLKHINSGFHTIQQISNHTFKSRKFPSKWTEVIDNYGHVLPDYLLETFKNIS